MSLNINIRYLYREYTHRMSEGDCVPKNKNSIKGHKIPSKDTQGTQSDKLMFILRIYT